MVSSMPRVSLGDVAREVKQRAPEGAACPSVGLEHLDPDEIELSRWNEDGENTFTKSFSRGQVLFGRRRAYLRKAAVAPFDGVCSGDITVIEARETLSPRLLPFIIQNEALFKHAVSNSAGSLSPRVKWQSLAQFEFNLPARDQQEKLADLLWTAQDTRNHYKQLLSICDDVIKSQFVEMFGDPSTLIGRWTVSRLDGFTQIITGNTPSRKHPEYYGEGTEWIKTDNIVNSVITTAAEQLTTVGREKARIAPAGSILMACIAGSVNSIGKVGLLDREAAFNQQINAIVPGDKVDARFLLTMLSLSKAYLCSNVNQQLKGILNKSTLSAKQFPVPPLPLQQEFADFATSVDKSKFAIQKALDELNATTKKILNQELGL